MLNMGPIDSRHTHTHDKDDRPSSFISKTARLFKGHLFGHDESAFDLHHDYIYDTDHTRKKQNIPFALENGAVVQRTLIPSQ
jgi:hypothetical protein